MTKQNSSAPYSAAVNTKFANTMDGHRRPLASQDPNASSSVADVAGAPPWKPQAQQHVPAATGSSPGGGPGAPASEPGPGPGPIPGSTSPDSAMVPAQQAQPYPGHDRNGSREAARRQQHPDPHHRRRRRGGSSTTLRYLHDQTTNIHDRLSGCQPGAPPEVEEWEEAMRLRIDRLTGIIDHPSLAAQEDEYDGYGDTCGYPYIDLYGYPYQYHQ